MSVYLLNRYFTMPYLLSLFIFAKCVMQGGDITSDITGQFHDLVLRVQYLHGPVSYTHLTLPTNKEV